MDEATAAWVATNLKAGYGEANTSYISSSKRNLASIKAAWAAAGKPNAKNVPDEFGCLYCHNSAVLKDDPTPAPN